MKNFVNPKKIKGQDKLDRIKDLMGKMSTLNESTSTSEVDNVKKGANGVIYGIVRENHSYFIKTTEKTSGNILAEDFNYIGGLQNKNIERYDSYAEALKQLNLKFEMLNESFGVKSNTNLFESDAVEVKEANASGVVVKEQKPEVIEDQKTVIKVDAPASAPVEDEVADEEEVSMEEDPFADEGGEEEVSMDMEVEDEGGEDDGDGYTKKIQKLTGKIGQLLRDKDEPDAELDKYVINSIVSAIDWEEIPDDDVEDIIAKIEGEDEEDGELEGGGEESLDIDMDVEEGGEDPFAEEGEEELNEQTAFEKSLDKMLNDKLEKLKASKKEKKSFMDKITKEFGDILKKHFENSDKSENSAKPKKVDESDDELEEGNAFTGALAKAKEEGEKEFEVDGKTHKVEESKRFSKKQLMENFLKKNINTSLNKILKEQSDLYIPEGETEEQIELSGDDVKIAEENMSVVDAIATGQNYLQASGDLDRDGDQIPNRLDMDSNMDGDLDHPTFDDEEFIEMDFDSLMGNSPAPTKEPGIAEPTTTPGRKKPRWKKIPRPEVNPKPKATDRRKFHLGRKGMYR
jgi:hypothetical protein